ncbi:hypothetical protein TREES_T100014974 [Tupaia chinensis]|uniref:Uncharacterized protein n=1 Tax=Tupaia chinensis TaxID=246437 RepID=L9KQ16_TUPCH|nr:hypothetical protein TREES_T100014974 [Tupaia chinensis]
MPLRNVPSWAPSVGDAVAGGPQGGRLDRGVGPALLTPPSLCSVSLRLLPRKLSAVTGFLRPERVRYEKGMQLAAARLLCSRGISSRLSGAQRRSLRFCLRGQDSRCSRSIPGDWAQNAGPESSHARKAGTDDSLLPTPHHKGRKNAGAPGTAHEEEPSGPRSDAAVTDRLQAEGSGPFPRKVSAE